MAQLICTFEEFNNFVGPRVRNDVATITKQKKNELGLICEECQNKVNELDAAHKHGRSRKEIIKIVLDECETEEKRYIIHNLQKTIKAIKEQHFPIEENFRFLCKRCHVEYDSDIKQREIDNIQKTEISNNHHTQDHNNEYQKEFELILSQNSSLRECLKELFLRFPDKEIPTTELREIYQKNYPNANTQKVTDYIWNLAKENFLVSPSRSLYKLAKKNNPKSYNIQSSKSQESKISTNSGDNDNPAEILCQNETLSWKYKLGWTSIINRKNIKELISKIEANFDCYPIARKSWYYHKRNDNDKQFSAIKTNKNDSEICFRVDPSSFSFADERIIHGKRWFFSEGKERKIKIIPENYDLIMECLRYSFDICRRI